MWDIRKDIEQIGLEDLGQIKVDLSRPELIEEALKNGEGTLADSGALICHSGKFTGRSPQDKFIVNEPGVADHIWWGEFNQKISVENFDALFRNVTNFLRGKSVYVFNGFCGMQQDNRIAVRFVTQKAWHNHFTRNMFIEPEPQELESFLPDFTVVNVSEYTETAFADLGLRSEVFIVFHLEKRIAIIGGTEYAGEIKKGIFSFMNYLLTFRKTLPMHCAANRGATGDVCLFFGLSGTGKTTLSTSKDRALIGDDEHGWSLTGIFNFEIGCFRLWRN